jgi:hypothetical protein
MSSKIEISRELASLLYGDTVQCWGLGGNAANQLSAILAAPVVERQCSEVDPQCSEQLRTQALAPELAELQAAIARLTADLKIRDRELEIAAEYHSDLQVENERLKGGQGEAVLQAREIKGEPATWEDMDDFTFSVCRTDSHMYETRILYRQPVSQPAPVAVLGLDVFKALEKVRGAPVLTTNQCYDLARELNACLDKVKELNQ